MSNETGRMSKMVIVGEILDVRNRSLLQDTVP